MTRFTEHKITHDDGLDPEEWHDCYLPSRDPRNHLVICTCGYRYSGTFRDVNQRGANHVEIFNRNDERRDWNDPKRSTNMPFHTW
jgi:hypothetical protein